MPDAPLPRLASQGECAGHRTGARDVLESRAVSPHRSSMFIVSDIRRRPFAAPRACDDGCPSVRLASRALCAAFVFLKPCGPRAFRPIQTRRQNGSTMTATLDRSSRLWPQDEDRVHRRRSGHHGARHPRAARRACPGIAIRSIAPGAAQGSGRQARASGRGRSRGALPATTTRRGRRSRLVDGSPGASPHSRRQHARTGSARAGSMALPSSTPGSATPIAKADRVANPGCYPTGAIALIRPLVDAGLFRPITRSR